MAPPSISSSIVGGHVNNVQQKKRPYGVTMQMQRLMTEAEEEESMEISSFSPDFLSSTTDQLSLSAAEIAALRRALANPHSAYETAEDFSSPAASADDGEGMGERKLPQQHLPKKKQRVLSPTSATAAATTADDPLCFAGAGGDNAEPGRYIIRATATYEDRGLRFRLPQRYYQQQYSSVYFSRLAAMTPLLIARAKHRWPGVQILSCIKDLHIGRECILIGTLYKETPLKPSVLQEYLNDLNIQTQVNRFHSSADAVFLEDQTARVRLQLPAASLSSRRSPRGSSNRSRLMQEKEEEDEEEEDEMQSGERKRRWQRLGLDGLVTGLLMAVRGRSGEGGYFEVADMCLAGAPPLPPPSSLQQQSSSSSKSSSSNSNSSSSNSSTVEDSSSSSPRYVGFVSGLRIGSARLGSPLHLQLLRDFLLGAFGNEREKKLAARIVRVVIAGNAVATAAAAGDAELRQSAATTATVSPTTAAAAAAAASFETAFEEVDVFLALLGSSVPLDLLPGAADPTTFSLPQLPLHSALLPRSRRYASIKSFTNPHAFAVEKTRFVGASGQPVKNICKFSDLDPLSALELSVESRCLAPTAPDTLSMYPFVGADPFCMTERDDFFHVYFSGNHETLLYKYMSEDALSSPAAPHIRQEEKTAAAEGAEEAAAAAEAEAAEEQAAARHMQPIDIEVEEAAAAANVSSSSSSSSAAAAVAAAARRPPGPLLLCIPDFSKDPTLVLVEINSLEVVPIRFAVRTSNEEAE